VYTDADYEDAVNFILNYPPEILRITYKESKDRYTAHVMDGGLYTIKLTGELVRAAIKWEGERQWAQQE
jgi:hypothetical protein